MVFGDHGAATLRALKHATVGLKQGQESVIILRHWTVVCVVPANHNKPLLATHTHVHVSNTVI